MKAYQKKKGPYGDHEQGGPYRGRKMGLEEEHATDIRERWRRAIGEAKTSLGTNGHGSKEVLNSVFYLKILKNVISFFYFKA